MVNRLLEYFEEPRDESPDQDYWEVSGPTVCVVVDQATADRVARQLSRRLPPRWLSFDDIFGAGVRVRSRDIRFVGESTARQRAAGRDFRRALQQEESSDRPWEDDV